MSSSEVGYCNGKKIYDKKGAVSAGNKRFGEDHTRLRIYECEYGCHWHLTKQLRGTFKKTHKKHYMKNIRVL